MNKKTMNENNQLDQLFNNLANNFIEILNEALEKEKLKTEYWKRKAFILANKKGLCQQHEAKEADHNFNNMGGSFEDYIKHGVGCIDCEPEKEEHQGYEGK